MNNHFPRAPLPANQVDGTMPVAEYLSELRDGVIAPSGIDLVRTLEILIRDLIDAGTAAQGVTP